MKYLDSYQQGLGSHFTISVSAEELRDIRLSLWQTVESTKRDLETTRNDTEKEMPEWINLIDALIVKLNRLRGLAYEIQSKPLEDSENA